MFKKLLLLPLVILLFACGNEKLETQKKLRKEVNAIHDAVMPKMGLIQKLTEKTKAKIKDAKGDELALLNNRLDQLKKGDKGMRDWMHNYKNAKEEVYSEETMAYLKDQKTEITKVRDLMLGAITNTKTTLDSLSK